jgi:GNAT superfamily N-acetyltransferase
MGEITLSGYVPGAIGRITELHGRYYHQHWGFDLYFEAKVATELSAFLQRFDPRRDGFWIALAHGQIAGSVTIDGAGVKSEGARLRWFIVAPDQQGRGTGNLLMTRALEFCGQVGFGRVFLWTFAGLDPARHLYEKFGFTLCEEHEGDQWGTTVREQRFELRL